MITFEDDLEFSNNKIYIDCLKQTLKLINENDVESHGRIHVGDVHGDLFQFLLPLKGLINITGYNQAVNEIEFTINNFENRLIYYHGDLVDRGDYNNVIIKMMLKILNTETNFKIIWLIGNHDMGFIMKHKDNKEFIHLLRHVVNTNKVKICEYDQQTRFIYSHTIMSDFTIINYMTKFSMIYAEYCKEINQYEKCLNYFIELIGIIRLVLACIDDNSDVTKHEICKRMDVLLNYTIKCYPIDNNTILEKTLLTPRINNTNYKYVIGHTIGQDRTSTINPGESQTNDGRKEKVQNKQFKFIDFGCSYAMMSISGVDNILGISTPDYVYYVSETGNFKVTNFDAYIIYKSGKIDRKPKKLLFERAIDKKTKIALSNLNPDFLKYIKSNN